MGGCPRALVTGIGGFVGRHLARQIALIERGSAPPEINVGNLEAHREFLDVRDVVRAYAGLMEKGVGGEVYHVAGGTLLSIRELLAKLLDLSAVKIEVKTDPSRFRPVETPILRGSAKKLSDATGWEPRIPLQQTLADLLDYWRGEGGP